MKIGSLLALAVCSLLLLGADGVRIAAAEVYKWTDESGQMHFTQDLSQVPPRYRAAAASPDHGADSKVNFVVEEKSASDDGQRSRKLKRIIQTGQRSSTPARVSSDIPKRTSPKADPAPAHRYDRKCNSRGSNCRRIQTPEFRQWKARQKAREAATEED